MSVTTSGSISDTVATDGDLWVGVAGVGELTVDAGSVKSITAAGTGSVDADARLWVGRPGGAPAGNGTVVVNGAGSVLEVVGGGRADAGASAQIGNGGTGIISVEAGATFRVVDRVGTAYNWATSDGAEVLNIGRASGGDGELSAQGGHIELAGTGAFMNVGRGGGTGYVGLYEGSTLAVTATIAAAEAGINIGRGSTGAMLVNASTVTVTGGGAAISGGQDYGAGISVGRDVGGKGFLTLEQGASLTISGDSNLPGTPGSYASLQIGRNGAEGSMALSASTVTLKDSPEGASLIVGRSDLSSGATKGSLGLHSASTIAIDSTGFANFGIGRGTGTTGTVTVNGGSVIAVQGDVGANLQVGTTNNNVGSTGGTGTLNINSTSTVVIQSDNAGSYAGMGVGQFGGTGTINIDGGTLRMQGAVNAFMQIGYQADFAQSGNVAAGSAGTGSLIMTNGAQLEVSDGTGTNGLRLGGGVGTATMEIRSGSVANLDKGDAPATSFVTVGGGVAGTGVATLLVSGTGSRLEGVGFLGVGFSGENNTTGGNGRLIVENGGRIVTANGFTVGLGGRLSGDGGTIEMLPSRFGIVTDGGAIGDTGGAIQTLTIIGNLGLDYAKARFDISSSGNDQIAVQSAGGTPGTSGFTSMIAADFDLNVLGGYKFTAGESRTFITSATGIGVDATYFHTSTIALNGQHADFSYYLGQLSGSTNFGLAALNSGTSGGLSTLDFGASQALGASYVYRAAPGNAEVRGGLLGTGGLAVGVDKVLGTSVGDMFDASQATQVMVLNGLGGNDTLLGGSGNDVLRGGADADVLTGGLGNDLFYFTAGELAGGAVDTVMDGGISTNDLIRIDGAQYYQLAVTSISDGARIVFDGGNGFIDVKGVGTSPIVVATSTAVAGDFSQLNTASKADLQISYFDFANSQAWTKYTELNNGSGQMTRQFGSYDGSGGSWDFLYDVANTEATYATRFDYFNASAQKTQEVGTYDSPVSGNTKYIVTYDPGNTQPYTTSTTYYDALDRPTQVQAFYDGGGSGITTFDPNNTQPYDNYTTYYDALGRADQTNGVYDGTNGSYYVNFDQTNVEAWQSLTVIYDHAGTVTQQWYTMDNGAIVYI
jgi:hypothetical protein